LKEYLSETQEEEVTITDDIIETPKVETLETPKVETLETPKVVDTVPILPKLQEPLISTTTVSAPLLPDKLTFSDIDFTMDASGTQGTIEAPKTIERLERISQETHKKRKQEEEEEEREDKLVIGDEISLDNIGIKDLNGRINVKPLPVIDIETL
jgi:hypothetical protein